MRNWGRNIDMYLIIPLAIVLAVLNVPYVAKLTGVDLSAWINSILLLALAVLSVSILQDRAIRRDLLDKIEVAEFGVIQDNYPAILAAEIQNSETVRLIGVSVLSQIKDYLSMFEFKLNRGDQLEVLVSDPAGPFVEVAATRDQTTDVDYQRGRILETIAIVHRIESKFRGRARIKKTSAPIDGEYVVLYDTNGISKIYYKHYGYKTRYDASVCLHIDSRVPGCFAYFKKHVEHLWDYASA